MFSKVRNFVERHRRKFIIGGVLVGGVYVAHRYVRYRLGQWQEAQIQDRLEKLKRQQHFESILSTSDSTVLSSLRGLRDYLNKELDIEKLLEKVRTKPDNRVELWEEIKIRLITYGIVSVYAESLLICALRIQLGIIGGQVLLNAQKKNELSSVTPSTSKQEIHKKYLEMTQHFLEQGVSELVRTVKDVVVTAFGHIELKQAVTPDDFLLAYNFVKSNVSVIEDAASYLIRDSWVVGCCNFGNATANGGDANSPMPTILSSEDVEHLNQMVAETKDILQCSDCLALLENLVTTGFRDLQELVRRSFVFLGIEHCPMVKVLPALKTQTAKRGDIFVRDSLASDCSKNFLANIYEAFCSNPQK